MKKYDESKLIAKMKPYVSVENLSQTKKYLKDAILNAIVEKKFSSEFDIVNYHIKTYKFYRSKLMLAECGKALKTAKQMAIKYQTYDLHLEILNYEINHITKTDFKNLDIFFTIYSKEQEEILQKHKRRVTVFCNK